MAEQKQPDISFAGGLAGLNPAELAPEDIQKYRDTTDQGIKALEERYKNPNWFKVAAGFAKPQLGGFLASLGNAAEAMGENVEQERANVLPVVQAKILREQSNMLLGQKIKQNDLFQQWKASGMPMDVHTYTRIASLGNDTEVAKSAKQYWDQERKRIETAGTAEELSAKYPRLDAAFKNFVDVAANPHEDPDSLKVKEKREQYFKDLDSARPPQTDAATWASMSREAKQDAVYKYQKDQQAAGLTKEGEFKLLHDQAMPRIATMGTIRDLALGKGLKESTVKDENGKEVKLSGQQQMSKLLGMFGGDNPFEIIAKAANEGRFGDLFKGADALVRQGMMTPEARREFEILTKLLAQQNVQLRNGAVNPTNAYQEIQTAATPGTFNSQGALVSILDLMAHGEKNNIDNYQYILQKHPDARHIGADPEFYKRQNEYANRHHELALSKPSFDRPDFYNPYGQQTQERQQEAAPTQRQENAPPSAPPTQNNAPPARRSSLAEEILRRRNQNRGQQ